MTLQLRIEVSLTSHHHHHLHRISSFYFRSVFRVTVLQQAIGDVADLQQVLIEALLHGGVDGPAHHLHSPLRPVLDVVPEGTNTTLDGGLKGPNSTNK